MSENEEIFETPKKEIVEKDEAEVADTEEVAPVVKKKPRKKREYTDEQRAKMLENLRKGRETSLKKRKAKKALKKEVIKNSKNVANAYIDRKLESDNKLLSKIEHLQSIIENREPVIPGEEVRKTVELFTAIYRSQRDKKPINFPLSPESDRKDFDGRLV